MNSETNVYMKTRAAILYKLNSPLAVEEIEIPKLKKGQVLVKMLASGICRTQLNEIKGYKGEDKFLPHLLGHEGSGIVEVIGAGVVKVKKGDYVAVSWIKGKGLEGGPVLYKGKTGVVNSGSVSAFSEYAVISENRLTKIDRIIPPSQAALIGCALSTGTGIVFNNLDVKPGSSIAVFGAGAVGISAVMGAVIRKCKIIIAIDVNCDKLRLAEKMGATHSLLFDRKNMINEIKKICPPGVDYAVEASGKREAMEYAFSALNDGGVLSIAGNLKIGEKISIDPFELIKGKKITGSWGGETDPDRDFPGLVKAYRQGKLNLSGMILKRFPLSKINEAFTLMEKNNNPGRMIIDFSE